MKKMRKLIPAFAMLMVAAIMMTTASFAWFTMNDKVTATGMEIQAKASGNLLISQSPMTAADKAISVDLSKNASGEVVTKKELKPITFTGDIATGKWQTIGAGNVVDTDYGTVTGALVDVAAGDMVVGNSDYFADYTIYLATAGDALTSQELYITLSGLVGANQDIAPAYSIAFYTDIQVEDGTNTDGTKKYKTETNQLVKTINYEDFTNKNGHTPATKIELDHMVTIPSTYGANADNKVGLKVVMRVYVDGALPSALRSTSEMQLVQVKNLAGIQPVEGKTNTFKYVPNDMGAYKFYAVAATKNVITAVAADGTQTKTDVLFADLSSEQDKSQFSSATELNGDWYVWVGTDAAKVTVYHEATYVNNAWVPTGSTTFSVTIGADDYTAPETSNP
jgi:hypothetical protein